MGKPNAASAALGKCIREARKAKGMSLTEAAKVIKVSGPMISDFEAGRRALRLAQVEALSMTLEFDIGPLEDLQWLLPRDAGRMLGVGDEGLRQLDDQLLPTRGSDLSHRRYSKARVQAIVDKRRCAAITMAKRKREPRFNWLYIMFARATRRAQEKGVPFDKLCPSLELPDVCPVLGIPLEYWGRRGKPSSNSPSLDRIVPALGYTASNLRVISHRANALKSNATLDEMRAVLAYMERCK
jgi:transcriptional regulator with XRE-family HTH domain